MRLMREDLEFVMSGVMQTSQSRTVNDGNRYVDKNASAMAVICILGDYG